MLSKLELTNFCRHTETVVDFTGGAQVIAITGSNGAGKSTLLEGIEYARYRESWHGKRRLASLVRRGAEHEGMQVEPTFTSHEVEYRVVRRCEKGKSSAGLFAGALRVRVS